MKPARTPKLTPAAAAPSAVSDAVTPSPALVAARRREARAIALAQIAAPFAAAGLQDDEALARAGRLLLRCEQAAADEEWERRDEFDRQESLTTAEAMKRMRLSSTKRFRFYAEQIGRWEECRRASPGSVVFSEHDLAAMLAIRRQAKKAKGHRRNT